MCQAIEEMRNDAREEGREQGREEGRKEGREEGHREGFIGALVGLVKDGILSMQDAAARANMSVSEFESEAGLKA